MSGNGLSHPSATLVTCYHARYLFPRPDANQLDKSAKCDPVAVTTIDESRVIFLLRGRASLAAQRKSVMFTLPLELQLLTIENVRDYDSLVALYDSLPSTSADLAAFLLGRIFEVLKSDRIHRLETLQACRQAVFEMRDILGIESLVPKFQGIIQDIDEEVKGLERAVEFRGLTHPKQGLTGIKKASMRDKRDFLPLRSGRRQSMIGIAKSDNTVDDLSRESSTTTEESASKVRKLWVQDNGQFCVSTFMDNLYQQQLLGLAS